MIPKMKLEVIGRKEGTEQINDNFTISYSQINSKCCNGRAIIQAI